MSLKYIQLTSLMSIQMKKRRVKESHGERASIGRVITYMLSTCFVQFQIAVPSCTLSIQKKQSRIKNMAGVSHLVRLILCAIATLGLTICEFVMCHFTHSISLFVVANQSLYNFLSLTSGVTAIAVSIFKSPKVFGDFQFLLFFFFLSSFFLRLLT